ncbi:hypothetical protein B0187_02700 [Haemophilus paracuniculus]|uniref:Alpha/beta hydrolase n=1 Tax=Haemophilus paracuniculus TaxID=734 RepID=A0A1T0AT64_9PAST|nr:hypothetical protein [Haemophilus paracuniculus]OOR99734.1 hypothetical protein B0187_02700 [Haemophilus paracuniculus]
MKHFLLKSALVAAMAVSITACGGLEQIFAIKDQQITSVKSQAPLEQRYTAFGSFTPFSAKFDANNDKLGYFTVYYPQTGGNFPLIVMANGSGTKSSSYEAVFRHLASYGFVVIGSQEESSWTG